MRRIDITRSEWFQREANMRTSQMMMDIAEGRVEPPVPNVFVSKKHGVAERLPFEQRTPNGQRKMIKLFVLEEMSKDVQASNRGRAP